MAIISQILSSEQWVNHVIAIMMEIVLAFTPDYEAWHDYDCARLFSSVCKKRKGTLICVGFLRLIPKFLNCETPVPFQGIFRRGGGGGGAGQNKHFS